MFVEATTGLKKQRGQEAVVLMPLSLSAGHPVVAPESEQLLQPVSVCRSCPPFRRLLQPVPEIDLRVFGNPGFVQRRGARIVV